MIARLDAAHPDFDARLARLLAWDPETDAGIESSVAAIVTDVRARGDAAVLEYTRRFDRLALDPSLADARVLRVAGAELDAALASLDPALRGALETAAARIRRFHQRQLQASWSYLEADGTRLGQRVTPIDRVGLYVPGGKAAYPSSVLMNAIPARVAGVRELAMVVPTPDGVRNAAVFAAARLAGIDEVWTIGGAHAVAALAYGTESIRAVDKIVGPGNAYVAEAKRRVFGTVGIDMIAGPSEILVVGDGSVPADWVAMDLFSQAEHDELAQAILISPDAAWLDAVEASIARQIADMPRRDVIETSLANRGALIRVRDLAAACALVDRIAPEHLELAVADAAPLLARIRHAGAIFCGRHSSEAIGDYCAGPSHVLPTMRTPRFSSPLGVYDFQKRSSVIEMSGAGAAALGRVAATIARAESLEAHARSAEYRVDDRTGDAGAGDEAGAPAAGAAAAALAARLVRPDVRAMSAYHVPPASGLIKLDAMENPWQLPDALRADLGRRLADVALNRYPAPDYAGLKAALAERFAVPAGASLVLGNGSDELISMLVALVAAPHAVVLAPVPSFVMYAMSSRIARVDFVGVPLDAGFGIDLPATLAAIDEHQPALVFVAYPNNPTGGSFRREDIAAIIARAPGLVVIDEAYEPFAPDSWMPQVLDHPNLLVMRTLSKWGLAGVRLGYLAGAPAWVDALEKLRPPYNIGVLNEAAARFCLDHAPEFARQAEILKAERGVLIARLRGLLAPAPAATAAGRLSAVYPSDANFVLVRASGPTGSGEIVASRMKAAGVLIKDAGKMDPMLANCLRLTVGTPDENRRMFAALEQALAAPFGD